jgi:hypothetical protein
VAGLVCTNPSGQPVTTGSTFPVGATTVTCRATDAAGNQNTCSFSVTVTPPAADLSLVMSGSPNPVAANGNTTLTYTLAVTNTGPQGARGWSPIRCPRALPSAAPPGGRAPRSTTSPR